MQKLIEALERIDELWVDGVVASANTDDLANRVDGDEYEAARLVKALIRQHQEQTQGDIGFDEISVDVSTGQHDAGLRAFASMPPMEIMEYNGSRVALFEGYLNEKTYLITQSYKQGEPPEQGVWLDSIVADRHETSGKWVLWYLSDEQALTCYNALNGSASLPAQPDKQVDELKLIPEMRTAYRNNLREALEYDCSEAVAHNAAWRAVMRVIRPYLRQHEAALPMVEAVDHIKAAKHVADSILKNSKANIVSSERLVFEQIPELLQQALATIKQLQEAKP